jgi:hypothetical protein
MQRPRTDEPFIAEEHRIAALGRNFEVHVGKSRSPPFSGSARYITSVLSALAAALQDRRRPGSLGSK